jgi:putative oxidoreductase
MKKIFAVPNHSNGVSFWLLILRLCLAAFMLTHGFPKLEKLMNGNWGFADTWGIGAPLTLALVVFAEFFCSVLLALGLATRLALIPLMITMAVAAFQANADSVFSKKELPLLYLVIYITLWVFGPGKFSIDKLIGGGKRR